MVSLEAKHFYLQEEDIQWVLETLAAMDVREKVGQLFCPIGMTDDREQLKSLIEGIKQGGILFRESKIRAADAELC